MIRIGRTNQGTRERAGPAGPGPRKTNQGPAGHKGPVGPIGTLRVGSELRKTGRIGIGGELLKRQGCFFFKVALNFKEEREISAALPRCELSMIFKNHLFDGCQFEKVFHYLFLSF